MALNDALEVDSGSYTPESLKLRRRLAEAMLKAGMDTGPIGHWTQGANRMVQAMLGGMEVGNLERKEKEQAAQGNEALLGLLGPAQGGSGYPSAPAAPYSAPAPQPSMPGANMGEIGPSSPSDSGMVGYSKAIASIESSGGNYKEIGPLTRSGDRAYGKYQVMGDNVGPWTKEILGQEMNPQQFINNPEAQEKVFSGKFGQYLKQTGSPQDAASMWFTGKPQAQGANRRDILGTTGDSYVRQFTKALGQQAPDNMSEPNVGTQANQPQAATVSTPNVDPAMRLQIGKLLANPGTRQLGEAMLMKLAVEQPKIQELETQDQFGRKQKVPITFNPATRQYERFSLGGNNAAGATMVQPAAIQAGPQLGQMIPQASQHSPESPMQILTQLPEALQESPAFGGQTVARSSKQDMLTPEVLAAMATQGGPQTVQNAAMMPAPNAQPIQQQPAPQIANGYRELPINVNTLPKPQEDFVYDLGPNGLPQFDSQLNPKMIPKKELDTRSSLAVKRGETQQESQQQQAGVGNIIESARNLVSQPGFNDALKLGRADFLKAGLPYVGEISPADIGYGAARASEPNAPVWGVMDDIKATQDRLKLIIGRPLLKGQGSVSDAERKMVANTIGELSKATSRADYQFKLNSISHMIGDMYNGEVKPSEAYSARPTTQELKNIYALPTEDAIGQKVSELAQKYSVPPEDMSEYVINQYRYVNGAR